MPIISRQLGPAVCNALGLDPSKTRSISIDIRPGSLVTARVELMLDSSQADQIVILLKDYKLEPA